MYNEIKKFFDIIKQDDNYVDYIFNKLKINKHQKSEIKLIKSINNKFDVIRESIQDVDNILDSCVHGHERAKRQIKEFLVNGLLERIKDIVLVLKVRLELEKLL